MRFILIAFTILISAISIPAHAGEAQKAEAAAFVGSTAGLYAHARANASETMDLLRFDRALIKNDVMSWTARREIENNILKKAGKSVAAKMPIKILASRTFTALNFLTAAGSGALLLEDAVSGGKAIEELKMPKSSAPSSISNQVNSTAEKVL